MLTTRSAPDEASVGSPKPPVEEEGVPIEQAYSRDVQEENHIEKLCTRDSRGNKLARVDSHMLSHTSGTTVLEKPEEDQGYWTDDRYAWVVVFCCFIINFNTWGMNSGFAIYLQNYLKLDLYPGGDKLAYAWVGGIAFGVGMVFTPIINAFIPIIGLRQFILIGNLFQFVGLMLASWATKMWHLYCTQGLMNSFGLAFLTLPQLLAIPMWFSGKRARYRVLAGGIASSGSGWGGLFYNLVAQKIVNSISVHWALRIQAIVSFGLLLIPTIFFRVRKGSVAKFVIWDLAVFRLASFYILIGYMIFCIFSYIIVLYSLAQWTTTLGETETRASYVSACVQIGSLVLRPVCGYFGTPKFFGPLTLGTGLYTLSGVLCLAMWIPARNYATAVIFALWMGGIMGFIYSMFTPVCAAVFGIKRMSTAFAYLWTIQGVAALFGPAIGLKLRRGEGAYVDPTQYQNVAIFCGVCFIVSAWFLWLQRAYLIARNRKMMEEAKEIDPDNIDFSAYSISPREVIACLFSPGRY